MTKPNVSEIISNIKIGISKHSPEILTGVGIAGMLTTTVLAVRATPKAVLLLNDRKDELETDKLPIIEVVKTTWKCYIPSVVLCASSIGCRVGASSVSAKRNAALATVYKLSETALAEYKEKVIETIGEKKEHAVKDKIAESRVKNNPVSKTEVFITDKGNTLCYETISGRYFKSDIDTIKKAENKLNRDLMYEMYVSLSELYDEIGLAHTSVSDELGWKLDDGLIELYFSSQIADDGTPCIVLNYEQAPKYGYSKFM